jgi:hypothetical protein
MKLKPWLQALACGMAVGTGVLLGIPSSRAGDDPPAANGEKPDPTAINKGPSVRDESKPAAKGKRKGKSKKADDALNADSAESASPKVEDSDRKPEAPPSEYALTKELLSNLSPEHMKSLGQMLEQDWKDRPEWGEMAVAILKNDFMRPGAGWWKPSSKRYDWNWLGERLDANNDGKVEREEFPSDVAKADQLFERLDRNNDGKLMPADFEDSETTGPAATKDMMSNQLFRRLDKDSNGRVTMDELAEFFRHGDKEQLEFLTPEDLRFAIDEPLVKKRGASTDEPPVSTGPDTPAAAFRMFLRGDMGWLTSGPQLGDPAPEFTLPKHDGTSNVTLSDSFGKRPVVLVFGSFT